MKYLLLALAASALILAACGAQEKDAPADAAAAEVSAEPAPEDVVEILAHGFITENAPPPASAVDEKGDGVFRDADGRPFQYALLGQKLPAFTAPTSDGAIFRSEDLNRWTVIYVWGVWCGDCVADGPYVAALERAIAQDPDLDFLSLHTPASALRTSPEELYKKYGSLEGYFDSAGYRLPSVVMDEDASVRSALQITWTPSYLLVSPDGVVRAFRTDLSVDTDQPVKTFLKNVAEVKKEVRDLLASDPADIQ